MAGQKTQIEVQNLDSIKNALKNKAINIDAPDILIILIRIFIILFF